MTPNQLRLFEPSPALPAGLHYRAGLISPDQERDLLDRLAGLAIAAVEFQGYAGQRRVVSFGWEYDFNTGKLRRAEDIPPFLLPLRDSAAAFAGLDSSGLQHVLITEYAPGAAIGWHKDKAVFGDVVGVSLLSPACSACGGRRAPPGSGRRSPSNRAPPTCRRGRRGPDGSTTSRPWAACATRSPSGTYGPGDRVGERLCHGPSAMSASGPHQVTGGCGSGIETVGRP